MKKRDELHSNLKNRATVLGIRQVMEHCVAIIYERYLELLLPRIVQHSQISRAIFSEYKAEVFDISRRCIRIFFSNVVFLYYLQPSPTCICIVILIAASLSNLPKFFEFNLIYDQKIEDYDYWTTDLSEDLRYIRWSSYNELITSGIFPLLALCYYNYEIYARIRMSCFIELGRYVGGK